MSENDWNALHGALGETEYLIEFMLKDAGKAGEFESAYRAAGLPGTGTAITYSLYRLLSSLSDGVVAALLILVAVLLILIACFCLRFTMIAATEEDYREIGVMKAIGIDSREIRRLYLVKYIALAFAACLGAYVLALPAQRVFTANMALYMGGAEPTLAARLLPLAGAALVFAAIGLFCRQVLRRFRKISAVEAMRSGTMPDAGKGGGRGRLSRTKCPSINLYLGITEVTGRFRVYGLLCFVFLICSFLMIVPLTIWSTMNAPAFITYMGAGESDIRIDLQHTADTARRFEALIATAQADSEITQYAAFAAASFSAQNPEGESETLKVETGDFAVFPLRYAEGGAPAASGEIALSAMSADALGKAVGDRMVLQGANGQQEMLVCGIYQDVTNGGKTAKAFFDYEAENILWYVVNMNGRTG